MATITTRSGKGSELTHQEMDSNLTNLNNDKLENINSENLGDLANVSSTAPSDGQVLTYNNANSEWQPQTASSGSSDLASLTDTSIASPQDGQVLAYNSGSSQWTNQSASGASTLVDLTDTSIASPSTGQVLGYNGSNWTNQGVDISTKNLGDLADVTVSAPSDGQVLTYSSANSRFEPQTPSGGGGGPSMAVLQGVGLNSLINFTATSSWTQIGSGWAELSDPDGIVSVSGDTFTLTSGTYSIHWFYGYIRPVFIASGTSTTYLPVFALRNTTDTTYPGGWGAYGGASYSQAQFTTGPATQVMAQIYTSIASSKTFDLVYKMNTATGTNNNCGPVGFDSDWTVHNTRYKQNFMMIHKIA